MTPRTFALLGLVCLAAPALAQDVPPAKKNSFVIRGFVAGVGYEENKAGFLPVDITIADGQPGGQPPNFLIVDCRNAAPRPYYTGTAWITVNHCTKVQGGDCVEISGRLVGSFSPMREGTYMAIMDPFYCQ